MDKLFKEKSGLIHIDSFGDVKAKSKAIHTIITILIYTMLGIWAILVLLPFYWMLLTSVKSFASYNGEFVPKFFTLNPTLENYQTALSATLGRYMLNTVIFAVATTALMLVTTIFAAFAFARLNFKGKNLLFTIYLSLMMVPNELVVITNYTTIVNMNLRNTFSALIFPSVASIFYIYLLRENFMQVPDNLYWAAKVDGTSDWNYLMKVMIPMAKPTIISILILKIIECWNSYVWPRLVTTKEEYFLVSNGIQAIKANGFGRDNIPAMMAAVSLVSLPLIILFLIFRNRIMEGVSKSGTKG